MATLVFTAIGTAIGGPLGGALGSLIGGQIDRAVFGSGKREGPRLKELAVTTSSYGTPIARHFGTMRASGSIIWATDLVEAKEKSGGKGKPSVTSYSYSVSFAVALSSRPIRRLGRIWADGNLLRGAAGDLKAGGELRIYRGYGDQPLDPLIASAEGGACPAFRGLAYCVFEALQLADFGNRIPALTFEIVADDGAVSLAQLVEPLAGQIETSAALPGLRGFSDEGGPLAATLASVDQVYPLTSEASGDRLSITSAGLPTANMPTLPEAAVDSGEDSFGGAAGQMRRRAPEAQDVPDGLRYYDIGRDYQAGLQRADGQARAGESRIMEFPGALDAGTARNLANAAADRARWARDTLAWRVAELDPSLRPGAIVRVPGEAGNWRIETWEWREHGVELELRRLPGGPARTGEADPGRSLAAPDLIATPTVLVAYELPWDGAGVDARVIEVAASAQTPGWRGAALYLEQTGEMIPAGGSGSARSVIGRIVTALPASASLRFEPDAAFEVDLVADDLGLSNATLEGLALGANRALVGGELLQFARARRLGGGRWRLQGLLRGRGGTEGAAAVVLAPGAPFVLLDGSSRALDPASLGAPEAQSVIAIGLADDDPAVAEVLNPGLAQRPLSPVHPRSLRTTEGGLMLHWTRRARGTWAWTSGVETPLSEPESYLVGLGEAASPLLHWQPDRCELELPPALLGQLVTQYAGQPLWVRQIGRFANSDPLLLTTLA
jgi:hypothetical protein